MKQAYLKILYRNPPKAEKPMSLTARAAQFAPFAALTGYEDAVQETARLTSEKLMLSEEQVELLNLKFRLLGEMENPLVKITYFVPDAAKQGGSYITVQGKLKKVDAVEQAVMLTDRTVILMADILEIESEWLNLPDA